MFIPSNAYNSNEIDLNGFQIEADSFLTDVSIELTQIELDAQEAAFDEKVNMYEAWVNNTRMPAPYTKVPRLTESINSLDDILQESDVEDLEKLLKTIGVDKFNPKKPYPIKGKSAPVAATPSTPAEVTPPIKRVAAPKRKEYGVSTVAAPILRR